MNNKELQAARRLLFLYASEAAEHIGGVTDRSWRRWEDGSNPVPADVQKVIYELLDARKQMINEILSGEKVACVYHMKFKRYADTAEDEAVVGWRLSQSVAAEIMAKQ